jgi:hypothetical protein
MLGAMSRNDELLDDIAERLRGYLDANPDAADTIEGVEQWWLADVTIDQWVRASLERALERLVDEGRLVKRTGADGSVIWVAVRPREMD